ncbi:phenylalanine 4-monooxygenase [Actinospongicola halichondriae]|uniref:phenylalanine 4-monooxygenase n=1 Tax=Actinospongicola halichondriae TaxID=3236844 RepID=UPI003D5094D3
MELAADLVLPDDHPGVNDTEYLRRRAAIATVGAAWERGQPIPEVEYSAEEDAVWATVSSELAARHQRFACAEYLVGAEALVLPSDRVPQLREVDERVHGLTGFHVHPVPGLVPTRRFYGDLADGVFNSTQYIRHHSVPFYTPEPDIVHEIIGHAQMLASPVFADLYRAAGAASRRAETDEALEFFSKVFWFTLEFGVVWEPDAQGAEELKTYGAGLLSSYGEITEFRDAEIRPWDLGAMGTTTYDITTYQPVLFAAPSFAEMVDTLGAFFESFDTETHQRIIQEQSTP